MKNSALCCLTATLFLPLLSFANPTGNEPARKPHLVFSLGRGNVDGVREKFDIGFGGTYRNYVAEVHFSRTTDYSHYIFTNSVLFGDRIRLSPKFSLTPFAGYSDLAFEQGAHDAYNFSPSRYRKESGLTFLGKLNYAISDHEKGSMLNLFMSYGYTFGKYRSVSAFNIGFAIDPFAFTKTEPSSRPSHPASDFPVHRQEPVSIDSNRLVTELRWGYGSLGGQADNILEMFVFYRNFSIGYHLYLHNRYSTYSQPEDLALTIGRKIPLKKDLYANISAGYFRSSEQGWNLNYYNYYMAPNYVFGYHKTDGVMINPEIGYLKRFGKGFGHNIGIGVAAGYALMFPSMHSAPKHLVYASAILAMGDGTGKGFSQPLEETPFHLDLNASIGGENRAMIMGGSVYGEYKHFVLGSRISVTEQGWKLSDVNYNFYHEHAIVGGYRIFMDRAWITATAGWCYAFLGNEELKGNGDNTPFSHLFDAPQWYDSFTVQVELAAISRYHSSGIGISWFIILNKYMPVNGVAVNFKFGKMH